MIVTGVVPFVIFLIAGTAELNRPPFDLVEAEQELVGGFHTEYSSIRFALFFLAEFMNTVTMSAIIVTLFLGGPAGPTFFGPGVDLGPGVVPRQALRSSCSCSCGSGPRCPRFRYDQLMDLGLEGPHPAVARLDAPAGQPQHRPRPATGTAVVGRRPAGSPPSSCSYLLLTARHAHRPAHAASWPTRRCSR